MTTAQSAISGLALDLEVLRFVRDTPSHGGNNLPRAFADPFAQVSLDDLVTSLRRLRRFVSEAR